jgi:hypothetical protein
MITYKALQADRRQFLALTGLTLSEFQLLLTAFAQAYHRLYPANRTAEGQPRQRSPGGGCKGRLEQPEDKLLFHPFEGVNLPAPRAWPRSAPSLRASRADYAFAGAWAFWDHGDAW